MADCPNPKYLGLYAYCHKHLAEEPKEDWDLYLLGDDND